MTSDGKTVLYSDHDDQHIHAVGLLSNQQAAKVLIGWKPVNERIITARFESRHAKTTIVQVYAQTEEAKETKKDSFYGQLQDTIAQIPSHDVKILIGDMNAQIDKHKRGLEHVIGPHGSETQTNNNGERFILFNSLNNMCIGNTYFNHKNIHKKTRRSPRGSTANEINYICIDKHWRSAILDIRVYRGADIGSNHYLLITSLRLRLKQKQITHPQCPFAVEKLNDRTIVKQYQLKLQNWFQILENIAEIEDSWTQFKDIITMSAEETIGRRRGIQRGK